MSHILVPLAMSQEWKMKPHNSFLSFSLLIFVSWFSFDFSSINFINPKCFFMSVYKTFEIKYARKVEYTLGSSLSTML